MKIVFLICIISMALFIPVTAVSQSDALYGEIYPILNELKKKSKRLTYIADDLEKINVMTIVPEERQMIRSTISQISHITTRCQYEIQLLGISKMISESYREFYYNERSNGLQSSKNLIENSLSEIALAYEKILNKAALLQLDKAKETILQALTLFEKSMAVLQKNNK
jgi:hypothetical protein